MGLIREPAVSGMFYPDNPVVLKRDIESYLRDAGSPQIAGNVVGIVSPHAGYMYSGHVAACGFKAITNADYDTVVVIAPSHRVYFEGVAIMESGSYRTPLGLVDIDEEMAGELISSSDLVRPYPEAHRNEHSLEVQLPFLQSVLRDFTMVPLIIGDQNSRVYGLLSDSIAETVRRSKRRVLIVGSTDLSHYYPYDTAKKLDSVIVRDLETFDIRKMTDDLDKGRAEACGGGPMLITMMVSDRLGASESMVMKYANSGDVTGDKSGVVGYVSAIFFKQ